MFPKSEKTLKVFLEKIRNSDLYESALQMHNHLGFLRANAQTEYGKRTS